MNDKIEGSHKALLLAASIIIKSFTMVMATSYVFCNTIEPSAFLLQNCSNYGYIAVSLGAVIALGSGFGFFIIKINSFNSIFPRIMKTDFLITAMYFSMMFIEPSNVADKVMIWLFGLWIFGMLSAPFNKERTLLKKIAEYGGLISLGILLSINLIVEENLGNSLTVSMMISSIMSIFGAGRT